MYDPSWRKTDPSTAAIIKLIEEKERNEAKYGDETKNWDIMRLKDASVNETSRYVEHDSSIRPWPSRGDHAVGPSAATAEGHWRRGAAPGGSWGQALAETLDKRLRAEIETVEWKVNRHSNSSEERDTTRSRRRNSKYSKKRERSRSVSGDRRHKRRQSRSRSGSKRLERSRSREVKRDRSGSRETRRRRSVSRDKKPKKRERQRSSSNDSRKRDPSPRKHTKTTQPTTDSSASSATAEMLSQFMAIMNNAKEKPAQNDTEKVSDHNVLPEFDPNNKGHAIVTWLIRVDDVAKLFGWNEKQTLQYSLPKLVGDARTWYQTLATVPFSWAEWKKTLLEQFPCPNFAEMLMEMSSRHALPTETLEQYFYAKVVLLNRCGFKGRQAVDCLVQGVETAAIRLCAHAAQFAEPEELLVYLKSAESIRQIPKTITEPLPLPVPETANTTQSASTDIKTKKTKFCFNCSCEGHVASKCPIKPKSSNIRQPFSMNGQMGKNLIRGPRPPGHQPRMNKATFRGPLPFRPMAPAHQPRMKNNAMRGPRPMGSQPEHEYIKPVFGKKCYNCKKFGHIFMECPEPKRERGVNASQGGRESSETQPAPPGLEE